VKTATSEIIKKKYSNQFSCCVIFVETGCACRLREIVRRLEYGQIDNAEFVDNLKYAAAVLENVAKIESMYCYCSTLSVCL